MRLHIRWTALPSGKTSSGRTPSRQEGLSAGQNRVQLCVFREPGVRFLLSEPLLLFCALCGHSVFFVFGLFLAQCSPWELMLFGRQALTRKVASAGKPHSAGKPSAGRTDNSVRSVNSE
jgi:hypothetical protein